MCACLLSKQKERRRCPTGVVAEWREQLTTNICVCICDTDLAMYKQKADRPTREREEEPLSNSEEEQDDNHDDEDEDDNNDDGNDGNNGDGDNEEDRAEPEDIPGMSCFSSTVFPFTAVLTTLRVPLWCLQLETM